MRAKGLFFSNLYLGGWRWGAHRMVCGLQVARLLLQQLLAASASAAKVGHAWMQQRGDSAGAGCRAMGGGRGYCAQAASRLKPSMARGKRALSRPLRVPRHAGPGKRRSGYKTIGGPAGLRATSFSFFPIPSGRLEEASLIVAVARRCRLSHTSSTPAHARKPPGSPSIPCIFTLGTTRPVPRKQPLPRLNRRNISISPQPLRFATLTSTPLIRQDV